MSVRSLSRPMLLGCLSRNRPKPCHRTSLIAACFCVVVLLHTASILDIDVQYLRAISALRKERACSSSPQTAGPDQLLSYTKDNGHASQESSKPSVSLVSLPWLRTLTCHLNLQRYGHLSRQQGRILLAMASFDNEYTLHNMLQQIPEVVSFLGPHRVHVSIYENSSVDKTPELILRLSHELHAMGANSTIHTAGLCEPSQKEQMGRIPYLAHIRNESLRPLFDATPGFFDTVLVMNDVWTCASDLLELVLQLQAQNAVMATSSDYHMRASWRWLLWARIFGHWKPNFYDIWVARTMKGTTLTEPLKRSDELASQASAVQMFANWGGMAAFRAGIFAEPYNIRFRSYRGTSRDSECFLICVDLWKAGIGKIVRSRWSRAAYNRRTYEWVRTDWRRLGPWSESERIVFKSAPPAKVLVSPFDSVRLCWFRVAAHPMKF